jgi:hypothetical protein
LSETLNQLEGRIPPQHLFPVLFLEAKNRFIGIEERVNLPFAPVEEVSVENVFSFFAPKTAEPVLGEASGKEFFCAPAFRGLFLYGGISFSCSQNAAFSSFLAALSSF